MRGQVHRRNSNRVQCVLLYNRDGDQSPRAWGNQGLPPGIIRENFLEVVTLGLEYRFSRQRGDALQLPALLSVLRFQFFGGKHGEGWKEISIDLNSLLGFPRGVMKPQRVS